MKSFDVHASDLKIHKNHVLQASAGTGKTYSIENLVVRLLIEPPSQDELPLQLPELLVMTFTRASTRELKARIRANIESAIALIDKACGSHDYLRNLIEGASEKRALARLRLESALTLFDEAQIYTIHSFCARMLRECTEEHTGHSSTEDKGLSSTVIDRAIKDFFRTQLSQDLCSPAQLELLLKDFKGDFDALLSGISREVQKNLPIAAPPSYSTLRDQFCSAMHRIKEIIQGPYEPIIEAFEASCPLYNQYDKRSPADYLPDIVTFVQMLNKDNWTNRDFDTLIQSDLLLVKVMDQEKLNKRRKGEPIFHQKYGALYKALEGHLLPIVSKARGKGHIFAVIAAACKQHLDRYLDQEELAGADQLLKKMEGACSNPAFAERVSSRYRFAIIDEFQDTDPIQWTILKKLFLQSNRANLALVGDPKQAIYGFRQADIHTYFEAIAHFEEESHASLDVNYRSTPQLVQAVNLLFSEENSPGLLSKPFKPALPRPNAPKCPLDDEKGAVHFVIATDKSKFIPRVVDEICHLVPHTYSYRDIAILVRDHSQAKEYFDGLTACHIPCVLERSGSVTDSPAFEALGVLLEATLRLSNRSLLLQTWGGPLFALTCQEATHLLTQPAIMRQLQLLQDQLCQRGIVAFFETLLSTCWVDSNETFIQRLLRRKGGLELYRDLRQLTDLLAEAQHMRHVHAEGLIHELRALRKLADDESERVAIRDDSAHNAVRILTIHVSKGLEYPIVFAVGVSKPSTKSKSSRLIPSARRQGSLIVRETADEELQAAYFKGEDEEKVRLAYVAMTRARDRLYVPVIPSSSKVDISPGTPSPLELLLGRFGQEPTDDAGVLKRLVSFDASALTRFIDQLNQPDVMSYEHLTDEVSTGRLPTITTPPLLIPPEAVSVRADAIRVHSYSSLIVADQEEVYDLSIQTAPRDFLAAQTPHTLPAGRHTGILLHSLLQRIPLDGMSAIEVNKALSNTPFKSWADTIHGLLQAVVSYPLVGSFGQLRLANLCSTCLFKEMEFVCSADEVHRLGIQGIAVHFLKGVIDLLFVHEGKYYVVDYKSNWLGPDATYYSQENLTKAMTTHHYHLQARLYAHAVKRYVSQFDDGTPFDELFGGIFYLFLRGMCDGPSNSGVVFLDPQLEPLC